MRRNKKTEDSGFNVWRSYSDMMAGVLLLFVLIMSVTLFQAQENYKKSLKEQQEKIAIQDAYITKVLEQQPALEEKESLIASQDETIKSQDEELAMRERMLAELAAKLDEQQAQLLEQQAQLDTQSRTLKSQEQQLGLQAQRIATQETSLNAKTAQLQEQQQKIDNIIGVKAEVVEALRQEFARNNVSVDIDAQTGALTLDANVMFEVAESELTDEGERALSRILPIYCRVLLNQDYKQYLAEIIIDGYTDTAGSYEYNLELSQQRSLAVAQHLGAVERSLL